MDLAKVLLIESARASENSFAPALQRFYDVCVVNSGQKALAALPNYTPDIVVLDAVSMRTSGDRIAKSLCDRLPDALLIHVRAPFEKKHRNTPPPSPADVFLHHPFTWRKLVNRIKRYLQQRETRAEDILQVGALRLYVPQRILMVGDQEMAMTPKLAGLTEQLMRKPNEVIARKTLIQEVWQTEYMGDTRTLDVHIRWLRERVEENPSRPKVIVTVRGVGYKLVPPAILAQS